MAWVDPQTKTTFANLDWDHYTQSRPPYPPSLTELVYRYRRKHPNPQWERLVDVGAGVGIASASFVADFRILHVSDPSPHNHPKAQAFLNDWIQHHGLVTQLESSQSKGEEAYRSIGENTADLVICATAAHFMDPDALVESIARILRPGGTLAIYSYWTPCFPDQSKRFNEVFTSTAGHAMKNSLPNDEATHAMVEKVESRIAAGLGGLDFVPLPMEYFDDPQRIRINSAKGEILQYGTTGTVLLGSFEPVASRVSPSDSISTYYSGKDVEAEGWSFDADKAWLYRFIDTLRAPGPQRGREDSELFKEWEEVFAAECPSGKVRTMWPVNVLLGTRK